MIKLFSSNATNFNSLGIGSLTDAISCTVSEEKNGAFTLSLQYPSNGKLFEGIALRSIIVCKPNPYDAPQAFRVSKISKAINKIVTISAEHISYDMNGIVVKPFSANGNVQTILSTISNSCIPSCPFSFSSDITTSERYTYTTPANLRSVMFGDQKSMAANFKGEWFLNNYSAYLYASRGTDRGIVIRYGKDIVDLKQEENCSNTYTGVIPYWTDTEHNTVYMLPSPYVVNVSEAYPEDPPTYDYIKYKVYDTADYFNEKPNPFEDEIRRRCVEVIKDEKIGYPKINLTVSIVDLRKRGFNELADSLAVVKLCDTITVVFPEMNIKETAQIIKTEYDVLNDIYTSIEIGDPKSTLPKTLSTNAVSITNLRQTLNLKEDASDATGEKIIQKVNGVDVSTNAGILTTKIIVDPNTNKTLDTALEETVADVNTYYKSVSENDPDPEITDLGWQTTVPARRDYYNIWQYTEYIYTDASATHKYQGPINLTGTKGTDGKSVTILGSYDTVAELKQAHPTGNVGDAYLVSGDLYVWDQSITDWKNVGNIQGPQGNPGNPGQSLVQIRRQYNTTTYISDDPSPYTWSYIPPVYDGKFIWTREEQTFTNPTETRYTPEVIDATLNTFGSKLVQNQNDIGLVVSRSDGGSTIRAAEIIAAVNGNESTVRINADQTWIPGLLSTGLLNVYGGCITAGKIQSSDGSCYFDLDHNTLVANTWQKGHYRMELVSDSTSIANECIQMSYNVPGTTGWPELLRFDRPNENLRETRIRFMGATQYVSGDGIIDLIVTAPFRTESDPNNKGKVVFKNSSGDILFDSSSAANPKLLDYGYANINADSGTTINFNTTFAQAPIVVASYAFASGYVSGDIGAIKIYNTTRTGFSAIIGGSESVTRRINWIAISG